MKKSLFYQKRFSELPGLQPAKTVRYALTCRQAGGRDCYGIRVTQTDKTSTERAEICLFTGCRAKAGRLLTYLYENAIPAAHCVSVVSDVCEATNWTDWMDEVGTNADTAAHCG